MFKFVWFIAAVPRTTPSKRFLFIAALSPLTKTQPHDISTSTTPSPPSRDPPATSVRPLFLLRPLGLPPPTPTPLSPPPPRQPRLHPARLPSLLPPFFLSILVLALEVEEYPLPPECDPSSSSSSDDSPPPRRPRRRRRFPPGPSLRTPLRSLKPGPVRRSRRGGGALLALFFRPLIFPLSLLLPLRLKSPLLPRRFFLLLLLLLFPVLPLPLSLSVSQLVALSSSSRRRRPPRPRLLFSFPLSFSPLRPRRPFRFFRVPPLFLPPPPPSLLSLLDALAVSESRASPSYFCWFGSVCGWEGARRVCGLQCCKTIRKPRSGGDMSNGVPRLHIGNIPTTLVTGHTPDRGHFQRNKLENTAIVSSSAAMQTAEEGKPRELAQRRTRICDRMFASLS